MLRQAKLSTTLKQTIPFGSRFLINPQNTYSGTETLASPPRPNDTPLMGRASIAQVFGNEGTLSTTPPDRHHGRAEVYGPLQVTTAVTDFSQAASNKSITADFKLHWWVKCALQSPKSRA